MKVPVSVLIPVKNEEKNLPRCLASVAWADEIFVVDSHSTDRTAAIAEEHGARVVQFDFNGTWPKKKNWALENLPFRHEWVFILDADEVLPPEAEAEFRAITGTPTCVDGYWINRRFMFLGKWLRHAYYPNWNLRLFKHRWGRYEKLTEADTQSGDNEVHEHVIVHGETGRLQSEMDHFAFPSVEVFVEKHNRYSNWEAHVALERHLAGSAGRLQKKEVGLLRRLKRISHAMPFRPLLRFFYVYVWQRGFLDGREGYYFARLHAMYELLCVTKTFELRASAKREKGNGKAELRNENFRQILGVCFFDGNAGQAVELSRNGGLVVAPAAPALVEMGQDAAYREALQSADFALTDSGFMVLIWSLLKRERLRRISGLEYLVKLLEQPAVREPGAVFWVMPTPQAMECNLAWLRSQGHPATSGDCYVAPHYGPGEIEDTVLLEMIRRKNPQHVIITLGGGVQERLGYYMKRNLPGRPAIHCIGAAIGFLSGDQVNIPMWADYIFAGWLFRCLSEPGKFLPRYWKARKLPMLLLKYGSRSPV